MRHFLKVMMCAAALCAGISSFPTYASSKFDPAYYAAANPDVAAVCGTDEASLLRHYMNFGMAEGRKPSEQGQAGDSLELTEEQYRMLMQGLEITARHPIAEVRQPPDLL